VFPKVLSDPKSTRAPVRYVAKAGPLSWLINEIENVVTSSPAVQMLATKRNEETSLELLPTLRALAGHRPRPRSW
jgi:hypothetical protein